MLFQTHLFLFGFVPAFLALYFLARHRTNLRITVLLLGSLVFYGWWDARFVPLLLLQTLGTWALAEGFFRTSKRAFLVLGITVNLLILCLFKYLDFLVVSVEDLAGIALPRSGWVLPIGISFYTFEMVSYLADLLRGHRARYPLQRFALFILFFPRLIAGPIVRHDEILPQFDLDPARPGLGARFGKGFALFTIGLAKKVLIADPLAQVADPVFALAMSTPPPLLDGWFGLLAFALQLYFDFSAYTDMAIGLALMMGLTLPQNFDAPYRALSLRDFWRRWHMTLSRYIRDYVYIPLGGSREGPLRFAAVSLFAMSLCGLWHGASWTFVVWGALHGLGLVAVRSWNGLGFRMPALLGWFATFLFVLLGWVLFRAPDFASASAYYAGLSGGGGMGVVPVAALPTLVIGLAVALAGPTSFAYVQSWLRPGRLAAASFAGVFVYCVLAIGGANPVSFIYFQF